MVEYFRRHHVALLALLIALGGTSYAAVTLAKDSVGAKQIKKSAVRSAEVKDRSLRKKDFKPGQLPAGPKGPSGPSGFVATRVISGSATSFALPGNMGNSIVTPANCRTSLYTAGADEVAVINLQVTGSPTAPANDVLYLRVMSSEDSGAFAAVSGVYQADTLNASTTHVANSHVQPLQAGTTYRWGTGLASNAGITLSTVYCAGSVAIYRS